MNQSQWQETQNLIDLDSMIWSTLREAPANRRSQFRTPVVATVSAGRPRSRTVVLREVWVHERSLFFHTDARSSKVAELMDNPWISWVFWDSRARVQIRAEGEASMLDGEKTRIDWENTGANSRKSYLTIHPPGSALPKPSNDLPNDLESRPAAKSETEPGRENFTVVKTAVSSVDWLLLSREGQRRAQFRYSDGDLDSRWVTP